MLKTDPRDKPFRKQFFMNKIVIIRMERSQKNLMLVWL